MYICNNIFSSSPCSYNLDLVNDENDINKRKIKYFNFDFFSTDENPFFEISYIAKEDLTNNFHIYRYHMIVVNEITRFISVLANKVTNSNGQVTKTTLGGKNIYNINFPVSDFIIPSTHIPFKFLATSSQKMHHVLTVDAKDLIFDYTSQFSPDPPTDDPPSEQLRIRNVESQPVDKYYVTINRPIEIFHDVRSTMSTLSWTGYILVTIDVNWNITMKFVTGDGWNPGNQWIYGRLWVASGNDNVESDAMLPDETIYDETFTNPNDNNRGYNDTVRTTHQLKAFRNNNEDQKIVVVQINKNSNTKTKAFNNDPNNNNPHYIRDGDEIYVLRYQGRIEGYYGGDRQTFPNMSIDISGDIKLKLPNNFKTGSGYKFLTYNHPITNTNDSVFYGYNHINKSYYNLSGHNINNMLYLNEDDVIYEINSSDDVWYVGIKNKIRITHTSPVFVDNNTTTNLIVIIEIDENWNISAILYCTDDANRAFNFQWVYGQLVLETDVHDVSKKFINNFILANTSVITKYTGDGIGIQRGTFYSIRPCADIGSGSTCNSDVKINTSQTNNNKTIKYIFKEDPNKTEYNAVPVTNLNDFIRIDASIINYFYGVRKDNATIEYVDRIGIRQPYSNITNDNKNTPTTEALNITPIWDYDHNVFETQGNNLMPDARVSIREALNYEQNQDGSFKVTIIRPIHITYTAYIRYYPDGYPNGSEKMWTILLQIYIDDKWNITYTYTTPGEAWFQPDKTNKHVQGEMRIFVNEVNNTGNNEVILKNDGSLVDGNRILDSDNYTFIGFTSGKTGLSRTINYQGNQGNDNNSNQKNFRSLDNLIRFDAKFASYYYIYSTPTSPSPNEGYPDKSPEYKDRILDNTITLCCPI
jgi:hypothetical protein